MATALIGASGSDKKMLCVSSVARAAPTLSAVNNITKKVCYSSYKSVLMAWNFEKRRM